MPKAKDTATKPNARKLPPALTPEGRESRCIGLAMDLVEQRLIDGTASSQETTYFLKLGSPKAKLERVILESQAELIKAKTEALVAEKHRDELYKEAIAAMRRYSGNGGSCDEEDQDLY